MPLQVALLFLGDAPIAPAGEVPARHELQVAPDVGRQLVKQFDGFDRLKDGEHYGAVVLAHHDLSSSAKGGAHRDRASAVVVASNALKLALEERLFTLLID